MSRDRDRGGLAVRVRQRYVHLDAERGRARCGGPVKPYLRRPVAPEHFDIQEAPGLQLQRLGDRLLGTEARGQMLSGPGAGGRVGALAVGEQPVRERGPALQRAFETLDLEQVDPDPGRAHSTVTVLARFRG